MRFLARIIMRGRVEAAMVASTFAMLSLILPPFSFLSSAAVALVTLRMGGKQGVTVASMALLATAAFCWFIFNLFQFGLFYGLALWLPVMLAAIVLRETRSWAMAIEALLLIAGAGVLTAYTLMDSPAAFWQKLFAPLVESLLQAAGEQLDSGEVQAAVALVTRVMTGVAATSLAITLIISLMLGRWWQSVLYNPGGFSDEFLSFRPHRSVAFVTLGLAAWALLLPGKAGEIGLNLAILPAALYMLVGTAVLHRLLAATRLKIFWLSMLYLGMFMIPQALLPVVVVGFTDSWFDWRTRIGRNDDSGNE